MYQRVLQGTLRNVQGVLEEALQHRVGRFGESRASQPPDSCHTCFGVRGIERLRNRRDYLGRTHTSQAQQGLSLPPSAGAARFLDADVEQTAARQAIPQSLRFLR